MLSHYRKQINSKLTEISISKKSERKHKKELIELEKQANILTEARNIFSSAAILTQNHLANHIAVIVTKALRATFLDKDVYFKVEFVERRNVTECDMWIEENGYKYSLLDSRGYGITDIASFALRIAYILLHPSDDVFIIDEPFRNLGVNNHEQASKMIKELASELNMQFIISTHSQILREYADKSFHIVKRKGISNNY